MKIIFEIWGVLPLTEINNILQGFGMSGKLGTNKIPLGDITASGINKDISINKIETFRKNLESQYKKHLPEYEIELRFLKVEIKEKG